MKKNLKKELKLKDGTSFPKGQPATIKVEESKPSVALLDFGSRIVKIRSGKLFKYFPGFVDPYKIYQETDYMDTSVESLTGEMVEPDGWDEDGFPSFLLALNLI